MKYNFNCEKCLHNEVCKNIDSIIEIKEKIETREHNIYIPENSFEIVMNCKHYKLASSGTIRVNGNVAQKS